MSAGQSQVPSINHSETSTTLFQTAIIITGQVTGSSNGDAPLGPVWLILGERCEEAGGEEYKIN